MAALGGLVARAPGAGAPAYRRIHACGPASKYTPVIRAAFVRRKGEYGMRWPGAVYDGEAARRMYSSKLVTSAGKLGLRLELRSDPIYGPEEADAWIAEAKAGPSDGLLVMVHDRQDHAWPTAQKAADSGLPTVVYSPLGTSFTTNTARLSTQPGCVIFSTDDYAQLEFGLKMLGAGARMRRARCLVIAGNRREESPLADLGIAMRRIPAKTFLDEYRAMAESDEMRAMADDYLARARRCDGPTRQDVLNGARSYFVASRLLEREEADAITMDCLGALGKTRESLPCLAWSRMNDDGVPAACEADPGAVAAHIIVQLLFARPGFQQDPVAETSVDGIIGAHCSCPTRLAGFDQPPAPFDIKRHHGNRDAVPRPLWREGERITCLDVLLPGKGPGAGGAPPALGTTLLFSTGRVLRNLDVPPAGGCVVSVLAKFDGATDVLSFPGFHQLFFYGDFKRELKAFCHLQGLRAQIA